jgi:hypothetical protein
MDGLEQLLISNVAAVIVTGAFIWYLNKKSILDRQTYSDFNTTLGNHLSHSNKVIKDNSKTIAKNAVVLQKLCDCIEGLSKERN